MSEFYINVYFILSSLGMDKIESRSLKEIFYALRVMEMSDDMGEEFTKDVKWDFDGSQY